MEKKCDFINNSYTGEIVLGRGYDIYDEWTGNAFSSRRVVRYVERAVSASKSKKTPSACVEALSCLFALELRITEKYDTFLKCLLSYFSWRRETKALKRHKNTLHITKSTDIRTAIEIELQRLRESLKYEKADDGDDDTHGGKRNGKAEDEAATEEKEIEETTEKTPEAEELDDKEEKEKDSEEKEETPIEEAAQEEAAEKNETTEQQQMEDDITATDEKEELVQKKDKDLKEENNVSDDKSELSTNKKEGRKATNDAVDPPLIYEETASERTAEKISLIDEIIIDNMVKGNKNIIGYQRVDEAERNKETDTPQDTVESQNEKNKSTDKDAYLYDKMIATDKGEAQPTLNAESTKQPEKVSEAKTEQPKETIQNNDNVNSTKQELKPVSEVLQSDNLNADFDNNIANALNEHMSLESKMALIRMKEEQLREHMTITLEELGMNDTSDVLRVSEPDVVSPPSAVQNRK